MHRIGMVLVCLASTTTVALAEEPMVTTSGLRNGFSLSAGQQFGGDQDMSGTMFGLDWRIGWRFTEAVSVHLDSHMSFGSVSSNAENGFTGTLGSAVIGEYKMPFGAFIGAGAGWGVLNNPNGPMVQARAGYYLFKTKEPGKHRHLNVALEYRGINSDSIYGYVNHVSLSIGYDRF